MPSGAKKRKAAKKKLEKQSNNFIKDTNNNESHSNSNKGSDEPKFHDERDSDGGDVEREGNVESSVKNHDDDEGAKEVRFGEGNVAEVKQQEVVAREFQSVTSKSTSSSRSNSGSSSSSSSDDDEVVVEKEEPVVTESGKLEPLSEEAGAPSDYVNEASVENWVEEFIESIPVEESVKEVVSLPEELTVVSESVPVDDWPTSDVISSELKQNVDEVLQSFEKTEVASGVIDLVEKIEEKPMPSPENTSEHVVVTTRNDEEVLPQSSGVKAVEVEDNGEASDTHNRSEEQPLLSSAPVTVRRTSWMNCCGLLEVFSGGSH